jgi:hypothetical protein
MNKDWGFDQEEELLGATLDRVIQGGVCSAMSYWWCKRCLAGNTTARVEVLHNIQPLISQQRAKEMAEFSDPTRWYVMLTKGDKLTFTELAPPTTKLDDAMFDILNDLVCEPEPNGLPDHIALLLRLKRPGGAHTVGYWRNKGAGAARLLDANKGQFSGASTEPFGDWFKGFLQRKYNNRYTTLGIIMLQGTPRDLSMLPTKT